MKTIKDLKKSEGTLLECSCEIIQNMIAENKWENTFIPGARGMSDEVRMSMINTYDQLVHEKTPRRVIREALDGIVIPHQNTWGGVREGAGRPATGRKRQYFYITDEENEKLRELLEKLRA